VVIEKGVGWLRTWAEEGMCCREDWRLMRVAMQQICVACRETVGRDDAMTRGYGRVKKARQGKAVMGMSWMWKKREEMKNSETMWFCVDGLPTAWQQPYS
jgi:hypothetical protein